MNDKAEKLFMSVEELAEILGVSKSLAYMYVQNEDCPFDVVRINSRYTIPTISFWEWYNEFSKCKQSE